MGSVFHHCRSEVSVHTRSINTATKLSSRPNSSPSREGDFIDRGVVLRTARLRIQVPFSAEGEPVLGGPGVGGSEKGRDLGKGLTPTPSPVAVSEKIKNKGEGLGRSLEWPLTVVLRGLN